MKSILEQVYRGIMHSSNKKLKRNQCLMCLEVLGYDRYGHSLLPTHFGDNHNNLNKRVWDVDYDNASNTPFVRTVITNRTKSNRMGNCILCHTSTGGTGIVEHYTESHPFLIRFLHKGNIRVL